MTLLSSLFLVAEPLAVGLDKYLAPDWFLNPDNGIFRSISHIRKTSLDTNHIDPINRILMMAVGGCAISMGIMQLLAKDHLTKRSFLKTKLYNVILLFLVVLHTAMTMDDDTSLLDPKVVGFFLGLHTANLLWLISDIMHYFRSKSDNVPRTVAAPSHIGILAFNMVYVTLWGIIKIFYPETLVSGHALPFWSKTPLDDEVTLDELSIFNSKIEGAYLLTFGISSLEVLLLDRSVERIRWSTTHFLTSVTLYLVVFLRASLDSSGYINRGMFVGLNALHIVVMGMNLRFGPNILEKHKGPAIEKRPEVPMLVEEQKTKKTK